MRNFSDAPSRSTTALFPWSECSPFMNAKRTGDGARPRPRAGQHRPGLPWGDAAEAPDAAICSVGKMNRSSSRFPPFTTNSGPDCPKPRRWPWPNSTTSTSACATCNASTKRSPRCRTSCAAPAAGSTTTISIPARTGSNGWKPAYARPSCPEASLPASACSSAASASPTSCWPVSPSACANSACAWPSARAGAMSSSKSWPKARSSG